MMTVKELSNRTGISVRTLHYYDEIGLFSPTGKTEAGYRLYDDKALETLQQILFFREFDIPLKKIKSIMDAPDLDRNQVLQMQRGMLEAKKERIARLISSIDDILRGENNMDFSVFNRSEMEEMFQIMAARMPENLRQVSIQEFGSLDAWREHYLAAVATEKIQKSYAKIVEWYGGKEKYLDVLKHPLAKEVAESFQKRLEEITEKLLAKRGCDVHSFEVKEIIGEYGFVMKQFMQIKTEEGVMLSVAKDCREERVRKGFDEKYGEGAAAFMAEAIEAFYSHGE